MNISGRGGSREGSGRPSTWNNKKTVAIRVPEIFSEQILDYARHLDNGEIIQVTDNVHNQLDNVQYQKVLQLLHDALGVPSKSFGKGKVILREIKSILESVQNQ